MCFSIIAQFGLECNSFPIGGSSFKACRRWEKICCLIRPLQLCFSNKANRRLENDLLLICSKHSKTKPKLLVGTDEWRQFCFGAWKKWNCSWLVLKCFIDWSFLKWFNWLIISEMFHWLIISCSLSFQHCCFGQVFMLPPHPGFDRNVSSSMKKQLYHQVEDACSQIESFFPVF